MTVEEKRILAEQAAILQDNPALEVILKELEQQAFSEWADSAPAETEAREHSYFRLQAIRSLSSTINEKISAYVAAARRAERKK